MSSGGPDLSNIPSDILSEIIKRLEVLDFLRSGTVCTTWRSNLSCRKYFKKIQIPWLMFSSRDKVDDYRYFYSMTEKKKYKVYLPDIGGRHGRHCIGSSQGFLISVDKFADLHATNPITGIHIPLPPTSNSPGIADIVTDPKTGLITHYIQNVPHQWMQLGVDYVPTPTFNMRYWYYTKVILSPSTDIAVAIYGLGYLAYARVGDNKWTALTCKLVFFKDATFHTGRLHAITAKGTIAIFDDLDGGKSTFVSPEGPLNNDASSMRYLVESPDGEDLFLVYKNKKSTDTPTTYIRVFLLDKTTYTWNQMTLLGDVALFLGINHSMSLCTREYPGLKRNSVYFTDDKATCLRKHKLAHDMGVFNLEDGRIEPIYFDSDLGQLDRSPPIWFMPTLS